MNMKTISKAALFLLAAFLLSVSAFAVGTETSVAILDESGKIVGYFGSAEQAAFMSAPRYEKTGEVQPMDQYMSEIASDPSKIVLEENGKYYFPFNMEAYVGTEFSDLDELIDVAYDFVHRNPGLFYLRTSLRYTSDLERLWIESTLTAEKIEEAMPKFEAAVDKALFGIKPGMTDEQKLLYLHDYLALHNQYDYTYTGSTAYDALVKQTSVCQGYAFAFNYLASLLGIETRYAYSDRNDPVGYLQNHGWSVVKLGDMWYYVDVTHDDPTRGTGTNEYGIISHQHFLLSEEGIRTQQINGYDRVFAVPEGVVATDKHYEHLFDYYDEKHEVDSAFVPCGGKWYFAIADSTDGAILCEADDPFDHNTWHHKTSVKQTGNHSYYAFSTVARYRDGILFSTNCKVVYYHPFTDTLETVFSTDEATDRFIFSIGVEQNEQGEDTLYVVTNGDGGFGLEYKSLAAYGLPVLAADFDDNFRTDVLDVLLLVRVIIEEETLYGSNVTLADLNENDRLDVGDAVMLIERILA